MNKYYVQYRDDSGQWNNIDSGTTDGRHARRTFLEESREDPEYAHRIIVLEERVIATLEAQENF